MSLAVRHDLEHAVHVSHEGGPLLSYTYRPTEAQFESPRPFVHPLYTRGGELLSLYRPHDHVWHKGIAWSLPIVGDANFWGGPTFVRGEGYVQLPNNGSQDHEAFTQLSVSAERATIAHDLLWHFEDGGEAVRESRELGVVLGTGENADTWTLTFSSTMRNVSGTDLPLGSPTTRGRENAGYGGLFWRGPRSFTGGTILAPEFAGGDEFRGVHAPWAGFTGLSDGLATGSTLVIVDDTANPAHPPQWFARTEEFAGLNPAPFFSEEIPFADGQEITFRYAVVIADGAATPERGAALAQVGTAVLGG